ncbi:hypothetical protein NA57DRAFT_81798 [Rhizodiscina lignyota]|uniref:Azaphilone pigments biosynthesis cluster protein L N-terminal domain-containing protein n=1 Tax=Rhizodiscina lignyota TaxID=1504668 RepID=A0A9P4I3P3_9PEZI|nr:hypothetical protein NA57DRAFT_81798 [Rhizodiscina lignyota]
MPEPITIVSAALGTATSALSLAKATSDLITGIKAAPNHITRLSTDLKGLYVVLGTLESALAIETQNITERLPAQMAENMQELLDNCVECLNDATMLIRGYVGHDRRANIGRWKAIKWELHKKSEAAALQKSLCGYKLTLGIACSSLNFFNSSHTIDHVQHLHQDLNHLGSELGADFLHFRDRLEDTEVRFVALSPAQRLVEGAWDVESDHGLPMRRFLSGTASIISKRSTISISPSMILSELEPLDDDSVMENGHVETSSENGSYTTVMAINSMDTPSGAQINSTQCVLSSPVPQGAFVDFSLPEIQRDPISFQLEVASSFQGMSALQGEVTPQESSPVNESESKTSHRRNSASTPSPLRMGAGQMSLRKLQRKFNFRDVKSMNVLSGPQNAGDNSKDTEAADENIRIPRRSNGTERSDEDSGQPLPVLSERQSSLSTAIKVLAFNERVEVVCTWSNKEYDRYTAVNTCDLLNPMLVHQIKEEVNSFKMVGLLSTIASMHLNDLTV